MTSRTTRERAASLADELERELRQMNTWRSEPLPHEMMRFSRPFGGDTMPFEFWIQFVLIPRLREVAGGAPIPPSSNLMGYAVREFDGREVETSRLVALLGEVDALSPRPVIGPAAPSAAMYILVIATLGWAGISVPMAYSVASWFAERQPQRALVFANFASSARGSMAGLVFQVWGQTAPKSMLLRGENGTLTVTTHRESPRAVRSQLTLEIDFGPSPPVCSDAKAKDFSVEWSADGLARWALAEGSEQPRADPQSHAVFKVLDDLKQGAVESSVSDQLQRIGRLLGDSAIQPSVEIRKYPASVSTVSFVTAFCAFFLPPTLCWMVIQYRRNLRVRRGLSG